MRRIIAFLCFVSLVTSARATTFTANLKTLSGGTAKVFVRLKVMNCDTYIPRVSGSNVVVSQGGEGGFYVDLFPDTNGAVTANIPDQASISCGSTTGSGFFYYRVQLWYGDQNNYTRRSLIRENDYDISGTSFNLNSATPKNVEGVNAPELVAPLNSSGFIDQKYLGSGSLGLGSMCLLDNFTWGACGSGGGGGTTLYFRSNGSNVTPRPFANFGSEFTLTDNASTTATDFSIASINGSKISGNISGSAANVTGTVAVGNGGTGATTAAGALTNLLPSTSGKSGQFLTNDGGTGYSWAAVAGSGTVTSIGLTAPAELTVSSSPITTNGNLGLAWATQTTNKIFAAPNGSTGVPTFRAMVEADLPATISGGRISGNINGNAAGVTGVIGFANGGTNASTAAGAIAGLLPATSGNAGKYLTNNGSGSFSWGSPSAYAAITENASDVTVTKTLKAPAYQATDTTNNAQFDWQAGSGGDTTCGAAAASHVKGCYRNNQLEASYNGDAYSKVLRSADNLDASKLASGTIPGARLGNPAVGTKGGVESKTCTGTDKLSAIGTDGIPVCSADQSSGGTTVAISKNGTLVANRAAFNIIEGTGVTATVADNSGSSRVDITLAASAGGGLKYRCAVAPASDTLTAATGSFATGCTLPANTLAVGDLIHFKAYGIATNTSTGNVQFKFLTRVGSSDMLSNNMSQLTGNTATNVGWELDATCVVTAVGASASWTCGAWQAGPAVNSQGNNSVMPPRTTTFDSTISNTLYVAQITTSAASTSSTLQLFTIEAK